MTTSPEFSGEVEFGPRLPSREQVLEVFSMYGPESDQSTETFSLWLLDQQKEVDELNIKYSRIRFNIDMAKLFFEAKFKRHAIESCEAVEEMLENEIPPQGEDVPQDLQDIYNDFMDFYDEVVKS
jgi:hypothetical protein